MSGQGALFEISTAHRLGSASPAGAYASAMGDRDFYVIEVKGGALSSTRTAYSATEALAICREEVIVIPGSLLSTRWPEVRDRSGAVIDAAELSARAAKEGLE